jgi:F-type H+-transporting ATPase subunit delta
MKPSKQARREAKQLFRGCFQSGLLDEDRARKTVKLLLDAQPRGYLEILTHFERLVKLDAQRRSARIESATMLPPDLQAKVTAGLTRLYGPGLNFAFAQNPALLGGLRIRVGSDVYDGSVQARLDALADSF